MCSCRTWLCSTLARSASGAVSLPRLRKIAVPGTAAACGWSARSSSTNSRSGPSRRSRSAVTISRPRCQVVMTVNAVSADEQRQPGAVDELGEVRGEEQQVDASSSTAAGAEQPARGAASVAGDVEEQQRGDGDGAGHGHAERVGQRGGAAEGEHEGQDRDHEQPVDPRARRSGRAWSSEVCSDPQPRQVAELGGLGGDRERAGDDGLGGDHGRGRGEHDQRQPRPVGGEQEERAADVGVVLEDQRALAQVAEHAGGEDQEEPAAR